MPNAECHAVQNLLAVLNDIDGFDLRKSSRSSLLQQLARKVIDRTGVSEIAIAILDTAVDHLIRPPDCIDVTLIREPGATIDLVQRNSGWWDGRLDTPLIQEKRSHTTAEVFMHGVDQLVLIQRVAMNSCHGAIRVVGPVEKMGDSKLWSAGLIALFQTLSTRRHEERRTQRQAYYNALVEKGLPPQATFDMVCREWHKLGQADFTWLWLRNQYTKRFEWAAHQGELAPKDSEDHPEEHFEPGELSASEYAVRTGKALYIRGDLSEWRPIHEGVEYSVESPDRVQSRFGCQTLIIVPFRYPENGVDSGTIPAVPSVVGTIAMHYRDAHATPYQRKDSLMLMSRYTAQAIVTSFRDEQRRLLVELNGMAQRHLTRVSRKPAQVRAEYLNQLIELIQSSLGFRVVSVFYRRPFSEEIECIASTGIAVEHDHPLSMKHWGQVAYAKGEGRTGECFASGRLRFFDWKNDVLPRSPKSFDLDPETGAEVKGTLFIPILRREDSQLGQASGHSLESLLPKTTSLGVIRCGKYVKGPTHHSGHRTTIHPVQLQSLEFIAQQVGPMLQILENNILRERTISTIKHDLFTQMNMIRDAVDRMMEDRSSGRILREYDLKNMGIAQVQGTNLIGQLDAEPDQQIEPDPCPTLIEGQILARVVNLLRPFALSYRNMQIEYDVRAIPRLFVDPAMIERAIHNLIVNAIKYGADDTTIRIKGRTSRGGYMLDVSNEGIGLDDNDAKWVGQPNYRSERTKHLAQGTGLGLYIARIVMRKHGGDLYITNKMNPTTISLFFPRKLER